ncbi:MAG: heme lyase CcmF/NrfE family subunit [Pseudomonadales bacterium]|nr:heme lyase CcmF/NrfE family subunit [Pseudomonadales bacterium]
MAFVTAILGYVRSDDEHWAAHIGSLVLGTFVFASISFVALVWSFLQDDFSVAYVANHSNSLLPWYYKISATWGGHEGSFVLWILFLCAWTLLVVLRRHNYPVQIYTRVIATLALLNVGFICFCLFTSDPFERLIPMTPADGADLNPLLQDFGLIVHPPMLYAGYVGLAVPFAFAIAALLENRVDALWARWVRPWTNGCWACLTVGITLGSWWAYYELGWGGWWFWDPSENASFMPWLAATALLHSVAVTEKRGAFKSWTLLLAISGFSLSLLGGFIIRSGVLTSVHAFAVDPERGLYILIFLGIVVGSSLLLYAQRAGAYSSQVSYRFLSREFFMLINNAVLMLSLAVVMWGTLSPMGYEALTDGKISLGPPFFNRFFVPLMLVLGVAITLVPVLNWKRTRGDRVLSFLKREGVIALVVSALIAFVVRPDVITVVIGILVAVWIMVTHVLDLFGRLRKNSRQPLSYVGMTIAHFGFACSILGVAITSSQSVEKDVRMVPQEEAMLAGMSVHFNGVTQVRGPNYVAQQGLFVVRDGDSTFELRPEKRRYLAGGAIMTEAGINPGLLADTYIALGEPLEDGAWAVRMHHKPMVRWVWLGALLMAFGGILAIFDVRYRRLRARANSTSSDAPLSGRLVRE